MFSALSALLQGFRLCFFCSKIRRLCLWPWVVGFLSYFSTVAAAFYAHAPILSWVITSVAPTQARIWQIIWYYVAWVLVALLLLIASTFVAIIVTLILTAVFEEGIIASVNSELGVSGREEPTGFSGTVSSATSSILGELIKLIWVFPLGCLLLIAGFIPLLAPVALILGSWLLAYQFLDVTLYMRGLGVLERLRFSLKHFVQVTTFGFTLSLVWVIPLLGIFLTPIAVAAAAWFLAKEHPLLAKKNSLGT